RLLEKCWSGQYGAYQMRNQLAFVGAAVNRKDFFALPLEMRRWLTGGVMSRPGKWRVQGAPTKPYYLPFQQCVLDIVKFSPTDQGRIHFVFDQQVDYEHTGRRIFLQMQKQFPNVKRKAGDIVYTSRKRARPLQVADFIAYESHRLLTKRLRFSQDPEYLISEFLCQLM